MLYQKEHIIISIYTFKNSREVVHHFNSYLNLLKGYPSCTSLFESVFFARFLSTDEALFFSTVFQTESKRMRIGHLAQ